VRKFLVAMIGAVLGFLLGALVGTLCAMLWIFVVLPDRITGEQKQKNAIRPTQISNILY
jgi:hypothetical protein